MNRPGAVLLTGNDLTVRDVVRVARHHAPVEVDPQALARVDHSRAVVERALERGELIYGFTTGVGALRRVRVHPEEAGRLNRLLLLNHRVGQGPTAPEEVVRATMLCLTNGLARGAAGVRPVVIQRLVDALNAREHPPVRIRGSVGEADLAPLADLASSLFADFELAAGEALALVNNNAFSTGWAALALADAQRLLWTADVSGALSLEGAAANLSILHRATLNHTASKGFHESVERLRALLAGSALWQEGAARNLQDPLTFRCLPQIHGACRDALDYADHQVRIALNAFSGNPLVVPEEGRVVSVGNFESVGLAAALDLARIALVPVLLGSCERAVKLLQAPHSGLPPGLAARPDLPEDALAEFGVAAQALAVEAKSLAHPVSTELASTAQAEGTEDRAAMTPLGARRLHELVEVGERLVAVELVVAAQAVDLRGICPLGAGTERAFRRVRERVPFLRPGDPIPQDLEPVRELVRTGELARLGAPPERNSPRGGEGWTDSCGSTGTTC